MSRSTVVQAYAECSDLSDAEELCFDRFVPPGPRVLDLGCGPGRMVRARGSDFASYVGVDSSAQMVDAARRLHPALEFRVGHVLDVDLGPGSVDVVLLMHNVIDGLHPVERRGELLRRVGRMLAPRGVLICSSHLRTRDQAPGYHAEEYHGATVSNFRSSMDELIAEVEACGFEIALAMRDYEHGTAKWTYVVGRKVL